MDVIYTWFAALSQREKIMVSAAGLLLAIIVGIYAITLPLLGAIDTKREEYLAALDRRGQIEARIGNSKNTSRQIVNVDSSEPLQIVLSQSSAEAGFAADAITAQGNDAVSISMAKAKPIAFMSWIMDLEDRGITTKTLTMKAGTDGTVAISAELQRQGT
jgi:general secretion pathway protein M